MAAGFMLALVGYLASGLFLHLSYARYYWLVLALAGAAASVILQATKESTDDAATPDSGGRRGLTRMATCSSRRRPR